MKRVVTPRNLMILGTGVLVAFTCWRLYQRLFPPAVVIQEQPVAVSAFTVTRQDLKRYVSVVGALQPAATSNLSMKAAGRASEVYAALGQPVFAGETLVQLDASDLQSQVKAAEAAYELASANLARVELSAPVLELAQAEAAVKSASAQVSATSKNAERLGNLYDQGVVPLAQYEAAQTQWEVAVTQLEMAKKNLEVVQSGTSQQAVAAARAQKKQAEATLELARSQLDASTLTAPFDGVVSYVNINPGEIVAPGVPIVGLVKNGAMVAEFMLSEKQVGSISQGQTIMVNTTTTHKSCSALVSGIAPSIDPRSRTYKVKAELIDAGDTGVKPGMMVEVRVLEDSRAKSIVVPEECLVGGSVDPFAYVVVNGKAQRRPVKLGLSDGQMVEVLSGLAEGDVVVRKGQTLLSEGKAVNVVAGGDR